MKIPPIENMPYRLGTDAVFVNGEGKVLIVQKLNYKDNEWALPGGGLEGEESLEESIKREIEEELGTTNFEILGESKSVNKFEWPGDVIIRGFKKRNKWFRGQEKHIFVVKFLGNKDEIKPQEEELRAAKWVDPKDLKDYLVFPGQFEAVKPVLKEFNL